MHVTEDGAVVGSIDQAKLEELEKAAKAEPQIEVEVEEQPEDDLDALRAQAEDLGIKVDRRWGAERLRQEIADVQEDN